MTKQSIQRIYRAAQSALQTDGICTAMPINPAFETVIPAVPTHDRLLQTAIAAIPERPFADLKSALATGYQNLHWRVDDGGYYNNNANVGEGYKTGNMHALLVGQQNCPVVADDLLVGLFLLAPRTLYRDHKHPAPEIYLPLTGPHGWRFNMSDWQDHPAGHPIFNAPGEVHATRVYDTPFLALFAWTQDTQYPCEVVPADDWDLALG